MRSIGNASFGLVDFDGGWAGGLSAGEIVAPDPFCVSTWPFWPYWERAPACGLGAELAFALPFLLWLRQRARTRGVVSALEA